MNRWEVGSFFHLDTSFFAGDAWLPEACRLYGSGRDALQALVAHGVALGWKRLFVPSYYCHEVTDSVRALIAVEIYRCNFLSENVQLSLDVSDAAIVVEYFGCKSSVEVKGGVVILDVTHDPCSDYLYKRTPDYTFASLRKTCFLPDGGCLWSSIGAELPALPVGSALHEQTSAVMLAAMTLKTVYLSGGSVDKPVFLEMYRQAEAAFGHGASPAAMSSFSNLLLPSFDMSRMRRVRAGNAFFVHEQLRGRLSSIKIVESNAYVVMLFDSGTHRDVTRRNLIENHVFPIALWPLGELDVPKEDRDLSDRVLMIHCDARYGHDDMEVVAAAIEKALGCVDVC